MQTVVKVLKGLLWAFVIIIVFLVATGREQKAADFTKRVGASVYEVANRGADYIVRVTA